MDCNQQCDFSANYALSCLPAVKALEREVLGCDFGGTSWTTRDQASEIMLSLALDSDSNLLEIGCGAGWPGLYLSRSTGCAVTLLDLPLVALNQAAERAELDQMRDQVSIVNASGTTLPFADNCFSCISHSDVLCCLPEKREMLRECRRVATVGARMHFSAIQPAADLSAMDHQRAVETGPPFVEVPGGYSRLLRESGWAILDRIDVSAEYGNTLQKLVAGLRSDTQALRDAFGAEELRELWLHREEQLEFVEKGLLERIVFVVNTA
jgi:SAM-dependent methyltransferase